MIDLHFMSAFENILYIDVIFYKILYLVYKG